jgi:hypothetical protein
MSFKEFLPLKYRARNQRLDDPNPDPDDAGTEDT